MYKVIIVKEDPNHSDFGVGFGRKTFELYLETPENVCALIQQLDEWHLGIHLEYFEFSKCDVVDKIKKDLDLK